MHLKPSTYFTVAETEARLDGQWVSEWRWTGISKISARNAFGCMFFSFNVPKFRLAAWKHARTKEREACFAVVLVLPPAVLLNLIKFIYRLDISEFHHNYSCELPAEYLSGQNFSHKICSVAFSLGKKRHKAFLLRSITFAHTIPGGHMARTTAVCYHWFMGQRSQMSHLHLCVKNPSTFLDSLPKTASPYVIQGNCNSYSAFAGPPNTVRVTTVSSCSSEPNFCSLVHSRS